MTRGRWLAIALAFFGMQSLAVAKELYSRAGWVADLPTGTHQCRAVVTIINDHTLYVEHLTYDGGAPAVYFYLGATNSDPDFDSGLQVPPLLDQAYSNDTLTLTLPPGETLDGYTAISMWCAAVHINFTSASFQPPAAGTYERAGWVADMPPGAHQSQGQATIITDRMIQIEHFTYDGGAPLVYFTLGGNDTYEAFYNGLEVPPALDASSDAFLVIAVPESDTLDPYTAISVWCAHFHVNFTSAQFKIDAAQDQDDDGDVDLVDNEIFEDCMAGPGAAPNPSMTTQQACYDAFDVDTSGTVDLRDCAAFQRAYTGPPAETAEYELIFDAVWSSTTHPDDFPPNPHFSPLVGGTHNSNVTFWKTGTLASPGMEEMAELGGTATLTSEVQAAITAGDAGEVISGSGISPSPGSTSLTFTLSQTYPNATVVSMIAPSPDWFVGVTGQQLFLDNQWTPEIIVPSLPYDAGTDSGTTYTSPDEDTVPHQIIRAITGYPFNYGAGVVPLGTFTFRRIN